MALCHSSGVTLCQALAKTFLEAAPNSHTLIDDCIPVILVGIELRLCVGTLLQNLQGFVGIGVFQQFGWCLLGVTVYLGQEAKPQHCHLLLLDRLRLELWQLHEHEAQPLDDAVGVLHVHNGVVMVKLVGTCVEAAIVDEVKRIDRLQQRVVFALIKLFHDGFRGIEDDALLELVVPVHLHFNNEMATASLAAPDIYHAILLAWILRNQLSRQILHMLYSLALVQGQQGVEQAHHQVFMFTEHLLKGHVGLRVEIFSFHCAHFFSVQR